MTEIRRLERVSHLSRSWELFSQTAEGGPPRALGHRGVRAPHSSTACLGGPGAGQAVVAASLDTGGSKVGGIHAV